jgi:dCTP deaminase
MALLIDDEIHKFASGSQPGVFGPGVLGVDLTIDHHLAQSQIRAAAIDLRIGKIYLPGIKAGEEGSPSNPKTEHSLGCGETAIITPIETFDLPPNVVGLVFPSSSVSIHGLLMTNPGYIDPGYIGGLRFTVVNMGKNEYVLEERGKIVTLILFRLDARCGASWRERKPGTRYGAPSSDDLGKLSPDFLNVEKRAEHVADEKVKVAGLSPAKFTAIMTVTTAVVISLASFLMNQFGGINELNNRITRIEANMDVGSVKSQLNDHQKRLDKLDPPAKK